MGVLLWKLLRTATRIGIEYWDGYDYLNNALLLTGRDIGVSYNIVRPPLISILNAVPLLFYKPAGAASTILPHLIAVTLSVLAAVALYRLLLLSFEPIFSLAGTLLLVVNPLFVHYSVFTLTDIPGMLFLTLGFHYYAREDDWLSAAAFLLAVLTRYSNALLIVSLVLFEIVNGSWRTALTRFRIKIMVLALLFFYLIHLIIFLLNAEPTWKAPFYILTVFRSQAVAGRQSGFVDPLIEFPSELLVAFTVPIISLAIVGFLRLWLRKTRTDMVMLCWFVGMFVFINLTTHKEARYLFCVFPPLIYATVAGFEWLWNAFRRRRLTIVAALAGVALMALPLVNGFKELERFDDSAYDGLFMKRVSKTILESSSPRESVYWTGLGLYNIYPKQRKMYAADEFIYFHHINPNALAFSIGKPVERLPDPVSFKSGTLISTNDRMYANMPSFEAPEPPEPITITSVGGDGALHKVQLSYR
jgi:hypothetical protein